MTRGELLEYLTSSAKRFLEDEGNMVRNKHLVGLSEEAQPTRAQIRGTLVAFINHIGIEQCIDYALSAKEL